jgi:hypothetical protein
VGSHRPAVLFGALRRGASRADFEAMPHFVIPTVVFEGDYGPALVIKALLESDGIQVALDALPVGGTRIGPLTSRIYVAREDETERVS